MRTTEAIEVEWKEYVYSHGGAISFRDGAIEICGLSAEQCRRAVRCFMKPFANAVKTWGTPLKFAIPGEKPIVITESLVAMVGEDDPESLIYTASVPMPQAVVRVMNEMLEHPRSLGGAIVRLHDELQIVVADDSGTFYPDPEAATKRRREEYWLPSDLEILRQRARSESDFELTYLAQDLPDEWSRITTRFRLFEDRNGNLYHDCLVKDFEELENVFNQA